MAELNPLTRNLMQWGWIIGRRLGSAGLALLGVTVIVFVVTHYMGDPVYQLLGQRGTPEQIQALRHTLGYDRPVWTQYGDYLAQLLRGNLGTSSFTFQPVVTEIGQRFPVTLELTLVAMLFGLAWTIPLGIMSARNPGGPLDRISQGLVEFGVAMPSFWLGLLFVFVFYFLLHLAPGPVGQLDLDLNVPPRVTGMIVVDSLVAGDLVAFMSAISHLVLPAATLAITACPPILQLTRNTMIEVLSSDYIRGARSFGLPERVIEWRYAFRNAMLPVLTMTAMTFGYLLGGTVLVETVFSWPGIGLYAVQSVQRFDYEPVLGVVIFAATAYLAVYFLADLLMLAIDPRIRARR